MPNVAARRRALEGPWTCHEYAPMIANVEFHDGEGTDVNVCAYWDQQFGDLLAQAWAVPALRELLERICHTFDDPDNGHVIQELAFLVPDARALLERLP